MFFGVFSAGVQKSYESKVGIGAAKRIASGARITDENRIYVCHTIQNADIWQAIGLLGVFLAFAVHHLVEA
jgi:hypothetical protein